MRGTMQPVAKPRTTGFTLIELMVVIVIGSILLAVAIPSYQSQIRKSRRTDAKTAVLELAGREERYFSTNGSIYSVTPADLGYPALVNQVVGSGYYTITVCSPAVAGCSGTPAPPAAWPAPAAPSYLVIAVPVAGLSQTQDAQCQAFFVDSVGRQMAIDSGGADASATCWSQ